MPDVAALQAALTAVAARHEVLRMRYAERGDGTVVGLVTPASDFQVPLEVVEVASKEAKAAALRCGMPTGRASAPSGAKDAGRAAGIGPGARPICRSSWRALLLAIKATVSGDGLPV